MGFDVNSVSIRCNAKYERLLVGNPSQAAKEARVPGAIGDDQLAIVSFTARTSATDRVVFTGQRLLVTIIEE